MEDKTKNYIIPFKIYSCLKWISFIACPAMAIFLGVIGLAYIGGAKLACP